MTNTQFPQLDPDAPEVPPGLRPRDGVFMGCGDPECRECYETDGTHESQGEGFMGKPRVSDHAIVRYLERAHGLDTDAIRKDILGQGRAEMVAFTRDGRIPFRDGLRLAVRDGVVTTVMRG